MSTMAERRLKSEDSDDRASIITSTTTGDIGEISDPSSGNSPQLGPRPTTPQRQETQHHHHSHHHRRTPSHSDDPTDLPSQAPPPYSSTLGHVADGTNGTNATVADDGRVNIRVSIDKRSRLSTILGPSLTRIQTAPRDAEEALPPPPPYIPPFLAPAPVDQPAPPPPLNVVIHVVGSRGDVQPFVALGKVLRETYGHRVRLATHPVFKSFVEENGLEFFTIGGDPAELMAFMVKNPGLMPGLETLRNGDVGKRRRGIAEIIKGCWRSCYESGDGSGPPVTDATVEEFVNGESNAVNSRPFVADAIIANPPSFAHVHIAERLGIPLHVMFTMPWSPTQTFPHPLANIQTTNADPTVTNFVSYALVDMLTWQGLGDIINRFRVHSLGLEPISLMWAPGILSRLRVPITYCWSPALISKPPDWGPHISISGFYFLSLASSYAPPTPLFEFLNSGPPPVYIGFGSIIVDDPNGMTNLIFDAVRRTGQRALVSKGWGGFGADQLDVPPGVFMLGNCPHDWLFERVSCVVHHGGAGTTAAGISAGRPTVVVPFFGDQPFWGAMVAKAGAGPNPIPHKELTAEKLAGAITEALKPASLERAGELRDKIKMEKGCQQGAVEFHRALGVEDIRCSLMPNRVAVWRVKRTKIRLSALAAYTLAEKNAITFDDLKLHRPREFETDMGPIDPLTGGAGAVASVLGSVAMGVADLPIETLKAMRIHPDAHKASSSKQMEDRSPSTSTTALTQPETTQSGDPTSQLSGLSALAASSQYSIPTTISSQSSVPSSASQRTQQGMMLPSQLIVQEPSNTTGQTTSDQRPETPNVVVSEHASTPPSASDDTSPRPQASPRGSSMSEALRALSENSRPRSRPISPSGRPRRQSHGNNGSSSAGRGDGSRGSYSHSAVLDPLDTVYGTGKGLSRVIGAGIKSPLDVTMAVTKGFHNMPRLYGEDVRKVDRVTGVQSGLKTAGKEFGIGLYEGISGFFTQPISGAKKEGLPGFVKGFGRGIAGIMLKPSAGMYALPAYAMMGVYKEIQKRLGESVTGYIIASRVAQGWEEWSVLGEQERADLVKKWAECLGKVKKRRGLGADKSGKKAMKAYLDMRRRRSSPSRISGAASASATVELPAQTPTATLMSTESIESQVQAVQRSETKRTLGIEQDRAAWEGHDEDEELAEAIRLSLRVEESGELDREELAEAIRQSLREEESGELHRQSETQNQRTPGQREGLVDSGAQAEAEEHEEELKRAITASLAEAEAEAQAEARRERDGGIDDGELERAIEESRREGDERERERREEDIVMEYVKRQSLLEEEMKRRARWEGAERGEASGSGSGSWSAEGPSAT